MFYLLYSYGTKKYGTWSVDNGATTRLQVFLLCFCITMGLVTKISNIQLKDPCESSSLCSPNTSSDGYLDNINTLAKMLSLGSCLKRPYRKGDSFFQIILYHRSNTS